MNGQDIALQRMAKKKETILYELKNHMTNFCLSEV